MSKIKISYQGIAGAYSMQAIEEFGKKYKIQFEAISKKTFRNLFDSIQNETHLAIVPIENSTAGSVVECYDLFLDYDLEIIAEYYLEVNHCLLGNKGSSIKVAKKIISHPQALSQCSNFIEQNNLLAISVFDTAGSAKQISEQKEIGTLAIASKSAAKQYNLEIIKENFQNNKDNTTRFLIVKKKNIKFDFEKKLPKKPDKSSIIFETKDIPSALYKALGTFANNDINLTKIESRPVKHKKFKYLFFIDVDSTIGDKKLKLALEELKNYSNHVIFLGSYKN